MLQSVTRIASILTFVLFLAFSFVPNVVVKLVCGLLLLPILVYAFLVIQRSKQVAPAQKRKVWLLVLPMLYIVFTLAAIIKSL